VTVSAVTTNTRNSFCRGWRIMNPPGRLICEYAKRRVRQTQATAGKIYNDDILVHPSMIPEMTAATMCKSMNASFESPLQCHPFA
jgi:hypothetical protein